MWAVLDGGGVLTGKNIAGVAMRGTTILVAVDAADSFDPADLGLFRSTDSGASFTQISGGAGTGLGFRSVLPPGSSSAP